MPAVAERRLPGIRFVPAVPPAGLVLPRMDIAGFAGFAAGGPFALPLPVEDAASFRAVFGEDLELARDEVGESVARSQLGPAVRAFFAGGGARCFVVRGGDAATASTTLFAVPGLLAWGAAGLEPARLAARSPGTWADELEVAAALHARRVAVTAAPAVVLGRLEVGVEVPAADPLGAGELLRVSGAAGMLIVPVDDVRGDTVAALPGRRRMIASADPARAIWIAGAPAGVGVGVSATLDGGTTAVLAGTADDEAEVDVLDAVAPPPAGSLVAVNVQGAGAATLWLRADTLRAGAGAFRLAGPAWWVTAPAPVPLPLPGANLAVERLSFELRVRDAAGVQHRLDDLAFSTAHERGAGRLPDDDESYRRLRRPLEPPGPSEALLAAALDSGFPLAGGPARTASLLLPLGMTALGGAWLAGEPPAGSTLARNGLATYSADLLVDAGLRDERVPALGGHIALLERPRGIHALYRVDDVTLIAAPDALHGGWEERALRPLPDSPVRAPAPLPDPSRFEPCATRVLLAPQLFVDRLGPAGRADLHWTATDASAAEYELEISRDPATFAAAELLYRGPELRRSVYLGDGAAWARVRALAGGNSSDWSVPRTIDLRSGTGAVTVVAPGIDRVALDVHRALLRLCAARGDVFAVLGLPAHFRPADALRHATDLRTDVRPGLFPEPPGAVPRLDASELGALSRGGLWHPWLLGAELQAPDGAVAGALALRSRTRGAWRAAANMPLPGVLALVPEAEESALQALLDGRVNAIRQLPDRFAALSQDTLAADEDLRPVNVRRLLDLLRRACLLHGPAYVFEPNDGPLRRSIQRGFEALLERMFGLGAFAGRRADEAFRVGVTSEPDAARVIVELRVAPARPLTFLTVRLVSEDAAGLRVEGP